MISDVLRDFVLLNNLEKQVGKIDSFKPPKLEILKEDFRGAGMDAPMPIDMGMAALECSWVSSGISRSTYEGFGLMNGLRTSIIVRGAVVDPVPGIPKLVYHTMMGTITMVEGSDWKPGERATVSATMSLTYYKLTHTLPGVPVVEVDVVNGVRIINGVDQLIALRAIVQR